MRVGLVGLGRMGRVHAANMLAHHAVTELLVLARTPVRARAAAHEWNDSRVCVCTGLDELLRQADGVVVATDTTAHPTCVRAAIRARVPVLCEKPVSLRRDTLVDLRDEAAAVGVPVAIGFQRRHDVGYQRLREAMATGVPGRPQLVRTVAHDRVPPDPDYLSTSGGIWRDLLIHDFDAMSWVLGARAVEVYAQGPVRQGKGDSADGAPDTALAVVTFADGTRGMASGARRNAQGYDCRIEIFGDRATLAAGFDHGMPVRCVAPGATPPGELHEDFAERFAPAFRAEIDRFLELVSGGSPRLPSLEAGIHALEVAAACELSQRRRRPVAIDRRGDAG